MASSSFIPMTSPVNNLKINYLPQEAYDSMLANDEINENEIYMTPAIDLTKNYLPLSAGSANSLTGDLYFDNNKAIRGSTTGLSTNLELNAFQACNSNNNLTLGYGGYINEIGQTNIYGNRIQFNSNDTITSDQHIEYSNPGYRIGRIYAKAARPSSNITLTTSNQKITLATSTFGSNAWFTLENGGITVEKNCYIKVWGYVYITNLTANDPIYLIVAKNGTNMINQYWRATDTSDSFALLPDYVECNAGDVITLMMRNSTAARGLVQATNFTKFIVELAGLK